jgi:HK97 family phage portal protein
MTGWSENRSDQARAFRHWTFVAISRIADRVACQAVNVARVQAAPQGPPKGQAARLARQKALAPIANQETTVPAGRDHPLCRLLADPNDPDTAYDLWYETVLFLLLTGNAYWWAPRNAVLGGPAALWVLPSHWVFPVFDRDGVVVAYDLRPDTGGYLTRRLPAAEVIHFRKKSPTNKHDGYSPQTAGAHWIDSQLSVDKSRWHTFKNGAFPAAALEFHDNYSDPTDDDLARIEQKFLARYAGETRAGKPLLLPPGVKYHKISLTPAEMAYVASADQLRDNILALFGVPAVVAGIVQNMTFGAIMAANVNFCSITVNPLLRFLGQVITEKLARPAYGADLVVYWDDATPEDPAAREAAIKTDALLGGITTNELRALRGRQPYAHGGDDPLVPHIGLVLNWGTGRPIEELNPQAALDAKPAKAPPADAGRPPGPADEPQDPGED